MRTLLFANNRLGAQVAAYLAGRGELIGLVLHPESVRAAATSFAALDVPTATWPQLPVADDVDCVLSVLFGHRIGGDILRMPAWAAVNLHPGLLPYNRGAAPNVWPILDGSPAGATLHVMEESIDTGPVLCQQAVRVDVEDDAEMLYRKLEAASFAMFCTAWPTLRTLVRTPQPPGGTSHRKSELDGVVLRDDELIVIDKIRARQFGPYAMEFVREGRRYQVRVDIRAIG